MDNPKVSFKAVLKGERGSSETRRFDVDHDVSTSLDFLKEILSAIFMELRENDFRYYRGRERERERERERKRERERERERKREREKKKRERERDKIGSGNAD
jgi:hypothetical protein